LRWHAANWPNLSPAKKRPRENSDIVPIRLDSELPKEENTISIIRASVKWAGLFVIIIGGARLNIVPT